MAINSRGLGRGIQALFEGNGEKGQTSPLGTLPISVIEPNPDQPRKLFNAENLEELAASIKTHGILQPLLVRPGKSEGRYSLIAGERRLRAAQMAGLVNVPVIIRDLSDNDALIVTLLENLQREDLNPIEEARGLEALRNAMNANVNDLAETLGQARSTIANSLRLLNLAPEVQKYLEEKKISISHAKLLGGIQPPEQAVALCERIIAEDLTTRQTNEAISFWNEHQRFPWDNDKPVGKKQRVTSVEQKSDGRPEILRKVEEQFSTQYNCPVRVQGSNEKGKIVFVYKTEADFDRLVHWLESSPLTVKIEGLYF